nr:MAG TPA: hypothetical protein [Bacteriophage sp.]
MQIKESNYLIRLCQLAVLQYHTPQDPQRQLPR